MATLGRKGKNKDLFYAVTSKQVNGKRRFISTPLGKFDRLKDAKEALAKYEQKAGEKRANKIILFSELKSDFLAHRKATKAEMTYRYEVAHFKALEKEFGDSRLANITHVEVERFQRKNPTWKKATWKLRLVLLKQFLQYANEHGFKTGDPFKIIKIPRPKIWESTPRLVADDVIDKVMLHLKPPHDAIVKILRYSGLRPADLFRLQPKDIDLKKKIVMVTSKGITRYAPVHPKIVPYLDPKLFPLTSTYNALRLAVYKAAKKAGIEKGAFSSYVLRHHFCYNLLKKTNNYRLVNQVIGHKNMEMTMRYTWVMDDDRQAGVEMLD